MTSVVQASSNTNLSGAGSVTIVLPVASGSTTGTANSIVVEMALGFSITPAAPTITDNKSNTYANNKAAYDTSTKYGTWIYSCLAPTPGVTNITLTFPNGGAYGCVAAQEVTPLASVDQTGSGTLGTSPLVVTASGADTGTTDFVTAAFAVQTGSGSSGISDPPSGYTHAAVEQNDASYSAGEICYRVNGSAVTDSVSWAVTNGASGSVGILVSFKPVSTGPLPNQIKVYANGALQAHQFQQTTLPPGCVLRFGANNTVQYNSININGGGRVRIFANGQLTVNSTIVV